MAIESNSTYALYQVRFQMFLAILCVNARCLYQQDHLEEPSAANMWLRKMEVLAFGQDYH